jgi:hypothetical protein
MLDKMFNQYPTIYKWDKFFTGFIPGLIGPVIGIFIFYLIKHEEVSLDKYLQLMHDKTFLSPLLSFGCIMNLVIFFGFISRDYYNASRGVILSTFIWAIPIIYTKFTM